VPKSFEIVDELPKTPSGKVSRAAIRKAVLEGTPVGAAKIAEDA
jgi:acyl-coenzyme A synthetase/AMP-(fatty) acid ligase